MDVGPPSGVVKGGDVDIILVATKPTLEKTFASFGFEIGIIAKQDPDPTVWKGSWFLKIIQKNLSPY